MADNKKEIQDLDAIIQKVKSLQQTIEHVNNTKSINRFGKSVRDALKSANEDITQVTTWTKALKSQRDELMSVVEKQPVAIQAQLSGLVKALGGLPKQVENIAKKSTTPLTNRFLQTFGRLQYLFMQQIRWYATKAITLNVLGIPSTVIQSVEEYNQGLIDIASVSRASQTAINELGKTIITVATTTKYGVGEIADAGKLLAQAGLSITEIQNTLAPIAQIATATGASIQDSADLVITALRAYKFESEEANKISDIFINTVTNSKVTIDGLKTAFNYLASTTANLNISLQDTSAMIGVLANSGQRLSTAATGLRTTLLALTAPTQKMQQIFTKYGITVDQVNPSLHSMTEILQVLSKLSKEDLVQAFSIRSANAILALQNAGAGAINTLREAINQTGVATAIASEQLLGLKNAWLNFQQTAISTAALLGNQFTDSFVDMLKGVQSELSNFNQSLQGTEEQTRLSFGDMAASAIKLIVAYQGLRHATLLFNNKFVKAAGASFSDITPYVTKTIASFNRLREGVVSSTTSMTAALLLFGKRIKEVFLGLAATLTKIAINPVFLAIAASIALLTAAVSQLIGNYVKSKQQIGEFLNNIDRQSVAIGKAITAVNKLTYEYESYNNRIKEAYVNNKELTQSLLELTKEEYNAAKIKNITENLKELSDVKFPESLKKKLQDTLNLEGVDTVEDAITKIFMGGGSFTEIFNQLDKLKVELKNYFSTSGFAEDLQRAITGTKPNIGEKGAWYVGRALVLKELKKFQKDVKEIINSTDDPDELIKRTTEALKKVSVNYRDVAKEYLEAYLAIAKVTSSTITEVDKDLSKLSKTFTDIQGVIANISTSLESAFYITPTQQLKYYDDLISALRQVADLNEQYNKALTGSNKEAISALKQQRDEVLKTVNSLNQKLSSTQLISSDIAKYLTEISKSEIDIDSNDIKVLQGRLNELSPALETLKTYFDGSIPAATKKTFDTIETLIKQEQVAINTLEAYSEQNQQTIEEIERHRANITNLTKAKSLLIGTQNLEIYNTKELVKTYKQLFTVNSLNLRQLLRLNKETKDATLNEFLKSWKSFTDIQVQNTESFSTFIKQLGISKDTFNELNAQYKDASGIVLTYSKVLSAVKHHAQSLTDAYKDQLFEVDEAIKRLQVYEGQIKEVDSLLKYLKDYKTSITIDFNLKNAEKFRDLQAVLFQTQVIDNTVYAESVARAVELANKKIEEELTTKYGFSEAQAQLYTYNKELYNSTQQFLDIQKQYADSIANIRTQIKEKEIASLLDLENWYIEQRKQILDNMVIDEEQRNKALEILANTRAEKEYQIYLDTRIKELQLEKTNYEERLNYLETFNATQAEKSKVRIEILKREKEEAVKIAQSQGKETTDIILRYDEQIKQERLNMVNDFRTMVEGFKYGMQAVASDTATIFQATKNVIQSFATSMENSIMDFLDYTSDGFLKWGNFVKSILNDLYKAMVQQFIISQMIGGIAGLFSPTSATSATSATRNLDMSKYSLTAAPVRHKGGVVGKDPSPVRYVPSSLFMNAPRLHSGGYIKSGEVPAILKAGEVVLTPAQMKMVSSSRPNVNVQVIDQRVGGEQVETQTITDSQGNVDIKLLIRDEVRRTLSSGSADTTMYNSYALSRKPIRR